MAALAEFVWPTEDESARVRNGLHRWLAERYPADKSTLERAVRVETEHHTPPKPGERQPGGK